MTKNPRKVRIFSALEVANLCGVVNQTAINWIRNGYLKAFTTPGGQYRVYAEDIMAFLESRGMRVPDDLKEDVRIDIDWSVMAVIDDDRDINDILKKFFERRDYAFKVVQAFDGFEAGAVLADKRPGFVILDIDIPGMDGYQICRKVKTDPSFGKPFVIAITGLEDPDVRDKILSMGADAFVAKPLDLDAIGSIVASMAGKVR